VLALALACALIGSGVQAGEARAYESFYTPFFFLSPRPIPALVRGFRLDQPEGNHDGPTPAAREGVLSLAPPIPPGRARALGSRMVYLYGHGNGRHSALRTPMTKIPMPSGSATVLSAPTGAVLAFSPNSSCTPVSQFKVSFAAISAKETTTSQAASSSQPELSVDSRAAA